MLDLFKRWREARRARAAAFAVTVKAEADRLICWKRGDINLAWWMSQDLLRSATGDRRRLMIAVRDELDSRIPKVTRPGADTATRMLYGD